VQGPLQPPHRGNSSQLKAVDAVNTMPFAQYTKSVRFENLTTIDPVEKFNLETSPDLIETRIIDLVTPGRKGHARADRGAAAHGQNDDPEADRQRRDGEPSGRARARAADR
jgi:hypothetical protein